MKCTACGKEWEGEGLCAACAETQAANDASEMAGKALPTEMTVPGEKSGEVPLQDTPAEEKLQEVPLQDTPTEEKPQDVPLQGTPAEEKTEEKDPPTEANAAQEAAEAPIPFPIYSEGFSSGEKESGKRPMKNGTVVFLTLLFSILFLALSYLCAAYFIRTADVFSLFHADPEDAESAALECFSAMYEEHDFASYLECLPPQVRESYVQSMISSGGYTSREEMIQSIDETQKTNFSTYTFSDFETAVAKVFTDEYKDDYLVNDYNHLLYLSDYSAQAVESIVEVNLSLSFSVEGDETTSQTELTYVMAAIDGIWYQIA